MAHAPHPTPPLRHGQYAGRPMYSGLADADPPELALADLRHDDRARLDLQGLVADLFAVEPDAALVDHAHGLGSAGDQPGLFEQLRDADLAGRARDGNLRHILRQHALFEARLEFHERIHGGLLRVEARDDFLRQQHLDVARVAPLLHLGAP